MIIIEKMPQGYANCNSCGTTENISCIKTGIMRENEMPLNFSAFNLCTECQKKLIKELRKGNKVK